jgi:predicted small secreted protein
MKTRSSRLLNIFLVVALLLSMQIACNTVTGAPLDEPVSEPTAEPTGPSISEPVVAGEPGTWLIMMYQDADDEVLEEDIVFDLNEAELVGSTDQVTIVSQMYRLNGGFDGDGDVHRVAHDPRRLEEAAALEVPLVLSGHTHGGQVVLPGVGAVAARKFPVISGLARQDKTTLFVSRGVGTVYVPIRLNCPPEVVLLTLRSENLPRYV